MPVTLYTSLEKQRETIGDINLNVNIKMNSVGGSDDISDSSNSSDSDNS